jgi:hypothetical protein
MPVVDLVPSIRVMDADLKLAGIDKGDETSGIVDFHALRKTLGTMMAAAGMSQRARQAHMRHTDPRLTESTYMDENLLPIAAELSQLPPIPHRNGDGQAEAIPLRANGTTDSAVAEQPGRRAENMQETSGSKGHRPSSCDTGDESDDTRMVAHDRHAQVRSVSRLACNGALRTGFHENRRERAGNHAGGVGYDDTSAGVQGGEMRGCECCSWGGVERKNGICANP